jgi:hypothetical protein
MRLTMIVLDDFFENPMEARKAALALDYDAAEGGTALLDRYSRQPMLWPNSDQMFSQIVREPVRGHPGSAHGKFRLATGGGEHGDGIQADPSVVWAGMLYMTLPQHCRGGVEFYRHKDYGTDGAPLTQDDLKRYGANETSREQLTSRLTEIDGRDRDKWEKIMTVPMRFNRLVLFRGHFWHTAGESFGSVPENCRLTQLFFFQSAQIAGMRR